MNSSKELIKATLFVLACLSSYGAIGTSVAFAADVKEQAHGPLDDVLLFEIHLDRTVISDGLNAYHLNHEVYLPLGELSRILTIAISTDAATGTAQGFIMNESRTLSLDARQKNLVRSGISEPYDATKVLIKDDDIYVESQLLSQWLPVDFRIDIEGLAIDVTAREQLPLQARLARAKLDNANNAAEEESSSLQNYDSPYQWIDRPFVDQTLSSKINGQSGAPSQTIHNYTTLAAGDFLGLQSNLYLSGSNQDPWEEHRFTMGRADPDGNLLGPLRARTFSFGAVNLPGLNYVAHPNSLGTGAVVSNKQLSKPTRFDTQSFSGILLPGWDVELFHNGLPIRHQQTPENGRYRFDDVPLLFGNNDFRLVFHGPQGQQREEHHRFTLEDSIAQPGEFYYSLGTSRISDGSLRTIAQFDKSIVNNVSLTGGFTSLPVSDQKNQYFNLGIRSFFESIFLSADAITASNQGRAGALGVRTSVGTVSISASQAFFSNFSSEIFLPSGDLTVMESKLRLDTFVPISLRLPVSLDMKRDILQSGMSIYEVNGKISTYFRGLSISDTMQYQLQGSYSSLSTELQLGRRIAGIGLRGSVDYNIRPVPGLSTVDLNAETALGSQYNLTESVISQFPSRVYRFETGINKGVGQFGFGANAGKSTSGEVFAGVRFNVALGVEPRKLALLATAEPMTDTGALSARVFVDKNLNGKFDEGEQAISGASFRVDGGQIDNKTDDQGILMLHHLPPRQRVNVVLDPGSIEDPQLTPSLRGVRLLPRPGKVAIVDFPLKPTTEIDGTLFRYDTGKKTPAADVEIELVNKEGQLIASTKSAYDGFYILNSVTPGRYEIRVSTAQAERLKLSQATLKEIRVLPNSAFISGMDVVLGLPSNAFIAAGGTRDLPKRELLSIQGKHHKSRPGHLFFVEVGAFADQVNSEKMHRLLVAEHLNFKTNEVKNKIPVYRVRVASADSMAAAESTKRQLEDYGYSASIQSENGSNVVYAGPYYSLKIAQQERTTIGAAFPSATLATTQALATLDHFSIGGFAWKERAEEVQAHMMDTGLIDESYVREGAVSPMEFYHQGKE